MSFGSVTAGLARSGEIFYRLDGNAVVIAAVEPKTTQRTPDRVIRLVKRRLKEYDDE
jgi:phage-related protein